MEPKNPTPCLALALLLTSVGGCARPATATPTDAPPTTEAPQHSTDEPDTHDRVTSKLPPPWWTPTRSLSLETLSEYEIAAAQACGEAQDLSAPDRTPGQLLAAARCFGAARAFGKEIAVYRQLLAIHRGAEEVADTLRDLGERLEQLDDRPAALAAYSDYLARYPASEDARVLGQRAACLAWSLDDAKTVDELLSQLDELYGRRGFVVPPHAALSQLCAGLPTARR